MAKHRHDDDQKNFGEMTLFFLVALFLFLLLALFGFSLTGETGREWGAYLRNTWGGAVVVPLLFLIYLCGAKLLKFSVPKVPRQVLGTIQLYISFAFLLGLLKELGWESEMTLLMPGAFGGGLAHFFVLNLGTVITLVLVIASFIFSAFLFGARILRAPLPALSLKNFRAPKNFFLRHKKIQTPTPRRSKKIEAQPEQFNFDFNLPPVESFRPKEFFMDEIPEPTLKNNDELREPTPATVINNFQFQDPSINSMPSLKQEIKLEEPLPPQEPERELDPIEKLDSLIATIDAEKLAIAEAEKKSAESSSTVHEKKSDKPRRPVVQDNAFEEEFGAATFPPPLTLFGPAFQSETGREALKISDKQGKTIISTLKDFGINASIAEKLTGYSVIQYLIDLAPGTKVSKIAGLAEDLSMSLEAMSVRIEAPIPGTRYVGIEVPNPERKILHLRNILESEIFQNSTARLPLPLGIQTDGKFFVQGLEEMPHMLIAGGRGGGKNNFLNVCILSLCSKRKPEELQLVLIDPRHVDFSIYENLPHVISAPIASYDDTLQALQWAYDEVEKRTENFARTHTRTLAAYNRKLPKKDRLPEIVIIISELSDLMYNAGNELEDQIVRLAQKSGLTGIHMLLASQRPSPDVVTTLIRSNIPARAAFSLSSAADSKNIIGTSDAEKLTGKGDMLFKNATGQQLFRLQTPYIEEEKILDFVEYMSRLKK